MKTNYILLVITAGMMLFFSSCTEEIDLELNDSFARLVVEGGITTDSIHQEIMLTKTTSYFYSQNPPTISGAQLSVTDGQNVYTFSEVAGEPGHYRSDIAFAGRTGNKYELLINQVDLGDGTNPQSFAASDSMRQILFIDSIYAIPANIFGISGYRVFGFAQEPATPGDFYLWRYYVNNKLITDTLNKTTFGSDQLVNGNYLFNLELGFFTEGKPGDTLTVETNTITETYFNFIIAFLIETQFSGGGFSGPPANIENNLNNGAMGFFNVSARSRISTVLP